MQPAEPVRAGHPDDAAVRPVHQPGGAGQGALLAHRVSVVGGDTGVQPVGVDGSGGGKKRAVHGPRLRVAQAGLAAAQAVTGRQSAQRPNTVRWPTSVSKPCSASSVATSGRATSGLISVIFPQTRQTRWTWSASCARW